MKKLMSQTMPPNLFTVASLNSVKENAIATRQYALAHTSGYPVGSHVVGRMQKALDLSSMKTLLESILQLRNLAKLAADILFTAPAARIDKQQFVRTELLAYVDEQTKLYGFKDLTEQDKDLIAYMIASTESPDTSWILDANSTSTNRIIQLHSLLQSLRAYEPGALVAAGARKNAPAVSFNAMVEMGLSPIYDPESDSIRHISETKKYNKRVNDAISDNKVESGNEAELQSTLDELHNHTTAILSLSYVRVWDHISALLTTTDIWNSFVSPRLKTDADSNTERARSLRTFATYLHSLLMYPHFFSIEAFRSTYDLLQENIVSFPPLPAHLTAQYENIISKHDLLNASGDVGSILSKFKVPGNAIIESSVSLIPKEFITVYGFNDAIIQAENAAAEASVPVDLTDLKSLNDAKYAPLTLAHPIARFDVVHEIADRVLIRGIVSNFILEACGAILPGVPKFFSEEAMYALKQLSLTINYGIESPISITADPTQSSQDTYDGSTLKWLPLSPTYSYSLRRTVRKDLLYKVDTNTNMLTNLTKNPRVIKFTKRAEVLRRATGKEWSTLMPGQWIYGDEYFAANTISTSRPMLERVLETLTGMNVELIERTIGNPYSGEIFATFFSSFALLYRFPKGLGTDSFKEAGLVVGYGMPYGTTYATLEAKQGTAEETDFIKITDTMYIRILKEVPIPTNSLNSAKDFMIAQPHYYYASNSDMMAVDRWVIAPGLLNFALAPPPHITAAINVLLDKRYAYLNQTLLIQANMIWTPVASGEVTTSLSTINREWNREKSLPNLEYITLTNYGRETEIKSKLDENEEETAIVALVKEMEIETQTVIKTAPALNPQKAPISPVDEGSVTKLGVVTKPIAEQSKNFGNKGDKKNKFKGNK